MTRRGVILLWVGLLAVHIGHARGVQIDLELYCTPVAVHVSQRYELPDHIDVPPDSLSLHPLVKDSVSGFPSQMTLMWKRNGEHMERQLTTYDLFNKRFTLPKDLQKKGLEEFTLLYKVRPTFSFRPGMKAIIAAVRIDPGYTMRLARLGATLNLSVDVSALMAAGGSGKMLNSGLSLRTGMGKQALPVKHKGMKRLWLHLERTAWSIAHDAGISRMDGYMDSELAKQTIGNMQDNDLGTAGYFEVADGDTLRMKLNARGAEALVMGNGLMLTPEVMRSFSRIARVQLMVTTTARGQRHTVTQTITLEDPTPPKLKRPLLACLPQQLVYVAPEGHSIESIELIPIDFYDRDAHPGPNRYAISELFFVRGLYSH